MNTDTSTKEPITQKTINIIGEIHPFFRFGKELDPFMHQEGELTAECPFYYLIDVDEQKQLYFLVQEAKPGEKTKILYQDTITNETNAKKILNEKKYPLFKILQSAIRQRQHKTAGSTETVAYDMITKLYQELANIHIDGELEFFLEQRKEKQHFQKDWVFTLNCMDSFLFIYHLMITSWKETKPHYIKMVLHSLTL